MAPLTIEVNFEWEPLCDSRFEATIALSLTTMLVMQTLQANISQELPKTSDIKMVDVWLMAGIIVPFLVFLVLVVVELLASEHGGCDHGLDKKRVLTQERFHMVSKVLIPIMTSIFVLTYIFVALWIVNHADS